MIDRDKARSYLQRRVTEHDLGVPNGNSMDPDVVALSAVVLSLDERMDEIIRKINQPCCAWLDSTLSAVAANKAAVALLVGAVVTGLAALADKISHFFK